jgi:hypothetical protein
MAPMEATIMHLLSMSRVTTFPFVSSCFLINPQLLTHD